MIVKEVIKETRKADYSLNDLGIDSLKVEQSDILVDLEEIAKAVMANSSDLGIFMREVRCQNGFHHRDNLVTPQQAADFLMSQVIYRKNYIARERVQAILTQVFTR